MPLRDPLYLALETATGELEEIKIKDRVSQKCANKESNTSRH